MKRPTVVVLGTVLLVCCAFVGQSPASIVENGGFETGNLTHWILDPFNSHQPAVSVDSSDKHSGDYGAGLWIGFLSQELSTVVGQQYELSFWLKTYSTPNILEVWWGNPSGGILILNMEDASSPSDWTLYSFPVTALADKTWLTFGFDPQFSKPFSLDDVSVSAVPEPTTLIIWSLLGAVGVGVGVTWWRKRAR
jgi:hypothetical protein